MIGRALKAVGLKPRLGDLRQHEPVSFHPRALVPGAGRPLPAISLVTPSRNQAAFIATTMRSVIDQKYPGLEYVVVDGASTDGTEPIVRGMAHKLTHMVFEPDSGQAEAINKGFRLTTGDIMGWLNSDDVLLPGALEFVGGFFAAHPDVDVVYGDRVLIDEAGNAIGRWTLPEHHRDAYAWGDFIPQETMFWRRTLWERVGGALDESFRFAMDWDLIARFDAAGARFAHIPRFLAAFRVHSAQKTSAQMHTVGAEESERILRRMHGRRVLPLERTIRLIPYLTRHALHDLKRRDAYRRLVDRAGQQKLSDPLPPLEPPLPPPPPPPDFGMQRTLEGLRDRGYRPGVVYDIGAAEGSWTRAALRIWPESHFVCFEPLEERRAALEMMASEHPGRVTIVPYGVGDADTELSFGVTDFLWDSSFAYSGSTARKLQVRTLDSLFAAGAIPRPGFVKIDVQGFERRVVRGGEKLLAGADFMLLECSFISFCDDMCTLDEMVAFMAERGFVPYEFVDFLRRPLDGAMGQCDILFARRDHALRTDKRWAG